MSIFDNIKHGFEQIPQGFQHLPQHLQHIPQELQKAGLDAAEVRQWLHHECQLVLESAAGSFAKRALREGSEAANKAYAWLKAKRAARPDLADDIDEVGFSLSLSAVKLIYDRFYERAEGLCKILGGLVDGFEFRRSHIKEVAKNTGPTYIDFNVSAEVLSSLFSVGFEGHIPAALGIEMLDLVLAEVGVPE